MRSDQLVVAKKSKKEKPGILYKWWGCELAGYTASCYQ